MVLIQEKSPYFNIINKTLVPLESLVINQPCIYIIYVHKYINIYFMIFHRTSRIRHYSQSQLEIGNAATGRFSTCFLWLLMLCFTKTKQKPHKEHKVRKMKRSQAAWSRESPLAARKLRKLGSRAVINPADKPGRAVPRWHQIFAHHALRCSLGCSATCCCFPPRGGYSGVRGRRKAKAPSTDDG